LLVENNIVIVANPTYHVMQVGVNYISDVTNFWRNNLLLTSGTARGACWGQEVTSGGGSCGGAFPGTSYDDANLAAWNAASAQVDANITGDPLFVNAAAGDFRLNSSSPARNTGRDIGLSYQGTAPDIGAIEFEERRRLMAPVLFQ
jgi:hypothetical protein